MWIGGWLGNGIQVQALANPAVSRKRDHEGAPRAAEQLAAVLNRAQKALASHRAGDALYDHWTGDEASKLERAIGDKKQWLDANASRVRATAKTADLPVKPAAFAAELQVHFFDQNPFQPLSMTWLP